MNTVQEVRIAKRTGFCYGVREAIDKAKEASAAGKSTHTLGQVVHNEGVVRELQVLGIQTVEQLDDVDHGAAVVIRAHGVRPDVLERANARGLEIIDGTCTWVIQEQRELRRLVEEGYTIVLLGTPKHPEVVGLLGFAPDAIVVDEEEEWEAAIPRRKRMALISQSTQPPWKFERLAAFMVVARPRAQDREHGLPGHDPPPGRHDGAGPRRGPHGRRRWPVQREHEGTHAPVRDRRDAGRPDRERPRSRGPGGLRRRDDRRRDRRDVHADRGPARRDRADPCRSPGRPRPSAKAHELALAALERAATPAGRTTSLPTTIAPISSGAA